jgi:hypothetical protein
MRSQRVNCRLEPIEMQILCDRARQAKIRPTTLLRDAAFAYLKQRFLLPPHLEETLVRLLQETRRIGTNLNQIAAKANALQRATWGDLRSARKLVSRLEERLRELDVFLSSLRPAG